MADHQLEGNLSFRETKVKDIVVAYSLEDFQRLYNHQWSERAMETFLASMHLLAPASHGIYYDAAFRPIALFPNPRLGDRNDLDGIAESIPHRCISTEYPWAREIDAPFSTGFNESSFCCLRDAFDDTRPYGSRCVNDEIVNLFSLFMTRNDGSQYFALPTWVYSMVDSETPVTLKDFYNVLRHPTNIKWRTFDVIDIPIFSVAHWSRAFVCNLGLVSTHKTQSEVQHLPCILFMDSLLIHDMSLVGHNVRKFLNIIQSEADFYTEDNLPIRRVQVPQQKYEVTCGYYSMYNSFLLHDMVINQNFAVTADFASLDYSHEEIVLLRDGIMALVQKLSKLEHEPPRIRTFIRENDHWAFVAIDKDARRVSINYAGTLQQADNPFQREILSLVNQKGWRGPWTYLYTVIAQPTEADSGPYACLMLAHSVTERAIGEYNRAAAVVYLFIFLQIIRRRGRVEYASTNQEQIAPNAYRARIALNDNLLLNVDVDTFQDLLNQTECQICLETLNDDGEHARVACSLCNSRVCRSCVALTMEQNNSLRLYFYKCLRCHQIPNYVCIMGSLNERMLVRPTDFRNLPSGFPWAIKLMQSDFDLVYDLMHWVTSLQR